MDESCAEQPLGSARAVPKVEPHNDGKESDGAASPASGRASPEANCPICLGRPENKSFTDSCLHQFCFTCLLEWSKVKAECPLCKQSFKSIIHTVRSIEDYEQYYVSPTSTEGRLLGFFAHLEPTQTREPFRYRTTAVSSYLDYFVRLEASISQHVIPSVSSGSHWRRRRQRGTSDFRRNVYQQGLWVQRTRDVTGRVRECCPEFYRTNPALVHRLVPWLNRELNVLCSGIDHQVQHVISRILDLITQVPIRSPGFATAIAPYIGRHTEHFVHEFYCFATSPYDMIGYDRYTNYVSHDALAHEPVTDISDDSSDSDVQIVGSFAPVVAPPPIPIGSDCSSDECVVVETVPTRQPAPEIITLDSDNDDVVQVNIHIGSESSQPGPSTSRRPPLKRNWLRVQNSTNGDQSSNVNVSINIAHTRGRALSRASSPSTSISSVTTSLSSVSWSPPANTKLPAKLRIKDKKKKNSAKGKLALSKPKSKKLKKSSRNGSTSPVVVRKRRQSAVLKLSSSDDEERNWRIVTDQELSSESEVERKPRLRSIVIKNIKPQPRDSKSPPLSLSPSRSDIDWIDSISGSRDCEAINNSGSDSNRTKSSHSRVVETFGPSCSHQSTSYASSSSDCGLSRKRKYSKKKTKRGST